MQTLSIGKVGYNEDNGIGTTKHGAFVVWI